VFRSHYFVQVRLTQYREFYELFQRLDDALDKKGLARMKLWGKPVGPINQVVISQDFETIAGWHDDQTRFQSDGDVMDLWRELAQRADGYPVLELWESAPDIS
jgi:hypothetical protein